MKIKEKLLIFVALIIVSLLIKKDNIFNNVNLSDFTFKLIIIHVAVVFIIYFCIVTLKDYLKSKASDSQLKQSCEDVYSFFNLDFPKEVEKTIDSYLVDKRANIALAVFKVDGEIKKFYWSVSNKKANKISKKEFVAKRGTCEVPVIFCEEKEKFIDFFIRGAEGEPIVLESSDIHLIESSSAYTSSYYTCSERKIMGYFIEEYKDTLENLSIDDNKQYELFFYTKRPPCKYCNDLFDYYRNKFNSKFRIIVLDNLLVNILYENNSDIKIKCIDDFWKLINSYEEKKLNIIKENAKKNNDMQSMKPQLDAYKQCIVKIVEYLGQIKKNPNKFEKDRLKEKCCISDKKNVGIEETTFDQLWGNDD